MDRTQRGGVAWLGRTSAARAVYDVVVSIICGASPTPVAIERARSAPADVWQRVLDLEGCAAWLDRARRRSAPVTALLAPAQPLVRAEGGRALRNAVAMVQQLAELAPVAAEVGARVLVLKGSARLLAGATAGERTMADIDLLVLGDGGPALHAALQSRLGYAPDDAGTPARHLPSLVRADSLPIEIHQRLTDGGSSLDRSIWEETRTIPLGEVAVGRMGGGESAVEIPSATAMVLHAVEHAVLVHRAIRYRLRDVIDVATALVKSEGGERGEEIDIVAVRRFADGHVEHRAAHSLLAAAGRVADVGALAWPADVDRERGAWRRIERVGRARLFAPPQPGVPAGSDPRVFVLSQMAEGEPGPLLRLVARGMGSPGRALRMVAGRWLPIEAERARTASREMAAASPTRNDSAP